MVLDAFPFSFVDWLVKVGDTNVKAAGYLAIFLDSLLVGDSRSL